MIVTSMAVHDTSLDEDSNVQIICQNGVQTGQWQDCANSLSSIVWNSNAWYDDHMVSMCAFRCSYTLKGSIRQFRWVWDATFQCGDNSLEFTGEARNYKNRRIAMQNAIARAIEQAMSKGKYTADDFKCN